MAAVMNAISDGTITLTEVIAAHPATGSAIMAVLTLLAAALAAIRLVLVGGALAGSRRCMVARRVCSNLHPAQTVEL